MEQNQNRKRQRTDVPRESLRPTGIDRLAYTERPDRRRASQRAWDEGPYDNKRRQVPQTNFRYDAPRDRLRRRGVDEGGKKSQRDRQRENFQSDALKRERPRYPKSTSRDFQYENRRKVRPQTLSSRSIPREEEEEKHSIGVSNYSKQGKQKSLMGIILSGLFNLLFYVFTLGLILTAILFALNTNSQSSLYGYRFFTVLTNSMAPLDGQKTEGISGFYAEDVAIIQDATYDEVQVNDVVTYRIGEGERFLTHRLIEKADKAGEKEGKYLITKGDANNTEDPPIEESRLVGKVIFVIPRMGYVLTFIRENFWICLVFVLGLFGTLLVLKVYFFGNKNNQ